jgi:glutathione synthase/RimK-type ligase-like ATP-grasp enzyme
MVNVVTIKTIEDSETNLIISWNMAAQFGLLSKKIAVLSFGNKKQHINLKSSKELAEETINISKNVMEELHLPEYPVFEITVNNNEIMIGPYIGLLLSSRDKSFTASRLEKIMVYFKKYSEIHGAIVVFALNKVNTKSQLIEGHCYNPVTNGFQKGVFPYPSAIFRKIGLSEKWKNHFLSAIGYKMFNSRYFNKWEMAQWFAGDAELNEHLPRTFLYKSPHDVINALDKFENIYVKPVSGLRGHKIVKISRQDNAYVFKSRYENTNYTDIFENQDAAADEAKKRFTSGRYLIQEAIELIKFKGGVIDFRCIMQKNQSGNWNCMAVIGRCGGKDSIVSNISSGGRAYKGVELLEKAVNMPEETRILLKEKIIALAIKACSALDEYGINCGSLGLDIGVDTNLNVWLIEINNRDPDPSISMNIHDAELYYNLKAGILLYAKHLAGFTQIE